MMEYGERYPDWGWCYNCGREVPLLTDEQREELLSRSDYIRKLKNREFASLPLMLKAMKPEDIEVFFRVNDEMTGFATGTLMGGSSAWKHPMHYVNCHRVDYFGPPCGHCGKLLRTSRASYCVECGCRRDGSGFVQDENA